ncbi:unnamed protein product [Mytilus edulis]|uniref:Uncharacterized protein n=1 Tax=Mytilus edulis TaxID=6550 RepID=A0A8S3TLQ6_MYTED|nr:unnamed protein product [Mytilus edulis]
MEYKSRRGTLLFQNLLKFKPEIPIKLSRDDVKLLLEYTERYGKDVRQRSVRADTTNYNAGTLPLNLNDNKPLPSCSTKEFSQQEQPEQFSQQEQPEQISQQEQPEQISQQEQPEQISQQEQPEQISQQEQTEQISQQQPEQISQQKPEQISQQEPQQVTTNKETSKLQDSLFPLYIFDDHLTVMWEGSICIARIIN